MARKVKTEQDKSKKTMKRVLITILVLVLIALVGLVLWKFVFSKPKTKKVVEVQVVDSVKEFDYSLKDKDSKYFKSEYEILKGIVTSDKIDEKAYATQVGKMFIIDLYSLSTKINKYDVGGTQFFNKGKQDNYQKKVIDTLYSSMLDNTYGDRVQDLPLVKEVVVNSTDSIKYKMADKEVPAYLVKVNITYEKDMGYDKVASVVLTKEDKKKWSVVETQATLKPKFDNKKR